MAKVKVAQGWLEGEHLDTVTGDTKYYSFKGIPYAEPPLGKLRFKKILTDRTEFNTTVGILTKFCEGNLKPINDDSLFIPIKQDIVIENLQNHSITASMLLDKDIDKNIGDIFAPRPPLSWDGIRKATEHGPVCPQVDIMTNELLGSEDCLYLNVYTPNLSPKTLLPVMFFIHGGGYKSGSGNDNNYGPDFLMVHDIVLVTINYRLEAFGFLCLDTADVPGNAGLKDQVAALKWVKENISNFGGNPNNVTIIGESAGGASVIFHIISPLAKGLFKRGISMSGVPNCDWSVSYQPRRRAFTLGKHLGLDTRNPDELMDFLQNLPAEKLIDSNPYVIASEERSNNFLKLYHFTPVVEKDIGKDHFLTEDPIVAIKNGKVAEVDILIGHTNEESLFAVEHFENNIINMHKLYPEVFVPRKILVEAKPNVILELSDRIINHFYGNKKVHINNIKEFTAYSSECSFVYDIYRFLRILPKIDEVKRYVYKFSCVSERNVHGKVGLKYGITGASHLDDLLYLFNAKKFELELKKESKEYQLVQLVCTIFTNFAKYGTPTPDTSLGVVWPEYDNDRKSYVEIGDTLTIGQNLGDDVVNFWKSIFEYAGLEF